VCAEGIARTWEAAMRLHWENIPRPVLDVLRKGAVIPAHPLALTKDHAIDEPYQRALTRYYVDAGVGGVAVGVHTTQFRIRSAGLYEPVIRMASEIVSDWAERPVLKVAGLTGRTEQAVKEADIAASLGYHAGLLNVAAFKGIAETDIVEHCKKVAAIIPLFGFYLLPEVGGIRLSADFWRQFAAIDNVIAIKIAPFNRYGTSDVVRGVVEAGAQDKVTLYTGNDDNIVPDLVTPFVMPGKSGRATVRMRGGLLGHWAFWTREAVKLLDRIHAAFAADTADLLALGSMITECNNAIYDATNDFKGCIAGVHDVLIRQGLMRANICLDPADCLGPGQREEIDRVYRAYPELNDDAFVVRILDRWLSGRKVPLWVAA
jgi:dihydrodipicolinate synthase/N-acetylneuraminate lyase